jgi:hypothetical protein
LSISDQFSDWRRRHLYEHEQGRFQIMDKQVGVATWPGSVVGLTSWSGSLKYNDGFQSESSNDGSLASDDSFLKSSVAKPGNVETIDARDPELTDTATTVYRPMHDLDPMTAPVNDPLDDDNSDELYKGSDEDHMESCDDSLDDAGELISQGFREMVSELLVVLLNRKRKRDELDGRADYELLTTHTRERKQNRGRAGSIVDRPTVFDDDGAVAGPGTRADPIVLSDSDSDEGDCGFDVARDGDAADESIAPTTVPVGSLADGEDCFGWLEY